MACPEDVKRVCIIGAGVSGITAIKNVKEYGLEPICFEQGTQIGGLWKFKENAQEGFGSVMKNTILNTSKEFTTFSDFAMDDDGEANFMPNQRMWNYFERYCEHFELKQHIQFQTKVVEIRRNSSYEATGKWDVEIEREGSRKVEVFDAVLACVGHHVYPFKPKIKGLEVFKGRVMHSHDYKDSSSFTNRNVLVVGLGNSGGDVICELARIARNVYGSTRNGTWVTPRVIASGYPRDVIMRTRWNEYAQTLVPAFVRRQLALRDYTARMDHELYGLRPVEDPGRSPVLLADDLPLYLSSGFVKIRGGISHFTENEVHFDNGTSEEIDDVIFCTGYDFDFNFLENGQLIATEDNQTRLWRRIFPIDLKWNSLAIIGLVDPLGPTMTVCEQQSRAVAHMWSNGKNLPSKETMNAQVDAEKKATELRFLCSARKASLQIDYIGYMDQLADIIGCRPPNWKDEIWNDWKLAFMLQFGPVSATHYRLRGPHSWPQASRQITRTFSRVHSAMNPQRLRTSQLTSSIPFTQLVLTAHFSALLQIISVFFVLLLLIAAIFF